MEFLPPSAEATGRVTWQKSIIKKVRPHQNPDSQPQPTSLPASPSPHTPLQRPANGHQTSHFRLGLQPVAADPDQLPNPRQPRTAAGSVPTDSVPSATTKANDNGKTGTRTLTVHGIKIIRENVWVDFGTGGIRLLTGISESNPEKLPDTPRVTASSPPTDLCTGSAGDAATDRCVAASIGGNEPGSGVGEDSGSRAATAAGSQDAAVVETAGSRGLPVPQPQQRHHEEQRLSERAIAFFQQSLPLDVKQRLFIELQTWKLYTLLKEIGRHVPSPVLQAIRSIMIERYLPDTIQQADSYYYTQIPEYSLIDKNDARQEAIFGMMEAFDEYDYRYGTGFMQFANARGRSRIQGAITDSLRRLMEYPRWVAEDRREIHPLIQKLQQQLGHKPSIEDFCNQYGEAYRSKIQNKLFASGVFNQHQVNSGDEAEKTSLDSLSALEDFRLNRASGNTWDCEDRANFQKVVLSVIEDDKQRFVIYAYFWLQWNIPTIAKCKSIKCSHSTALSLLDAGKKKIRASFTYQHMLELLHKSR